MKVVAFNGSPNREGNTSLLIQAVFKELEQEGIQTELIQIPQSLKYCTGCFQCYEKKDGCAQKSDKLNEYVAKMTEADGILLGSPVYIGDVSGQMKAFLDRATLVAGANGAPLQYKVGAAVCAVRRCGSMHAFHTMNNFFTCTHMVVVGSSYWNMAFGNDTGEVLGDPEGMETMHNLGRNMAYVMKKMAK